MYDQCGLLPLTHCVMTGKLLSFLHLVLLLYKWEILFSSKTLWDPWIKGDYFFCTPTEYINLKWESAANSRFCGSLLPVQTQYDESCSLWIVLKHLVFLKTSVKHKQKEGFRSDLALESVFCWSLFVVKYSFNKTSLTCALVTTILFSLIRQTLYHLQMK